MDLAELNRYKLYRMEYEDLMKRIDALADTRRSPSLSSDGSAHQGNSSPVERAVERRQKLYDMACKYADVMWSIEYWIEQVDDITVRLICRHRFIDGESWKEVANSVNRLSHTSCEQLLNEYLKTHE